MFGSRNIVHDVPISRIDLLVCRNLQIYLETETQCLVLPRLQAETQGPRSKLFKRGAPPLLNSRDGCGSVGIVGVTDRF